MEKCDINTAVRPMCLLAEVMYTLRTAVLCCHTFQIWRHQESVLLAVIC